MITVKKFVFNSFQVNTYVLFDETKECVIIDAACYEDFEKEELVEYIAKEGLKPVRLLDTHCHIDHILGNNFVADKYNLGIEIHRDGLPFHKGVKNHGVAFGFDLEPLTEPSNFFKDGDKIKFGNSELEVLYTPGHADGSVCFLNRKQKFVIVGDVLFNQSIGRTDLPTGDYDLLIKSIREKLFTLPDDFTVYPGHGPETSIGFEKVNNPYLTM
ncbi:MAG: MBL fold metallo-hydrolase [Bacteroidales bacterium]|nr:MBL fold metallo-hydrolase [Bacteroidales bacterium]